MITIYKEDVINSVRYGDHTEYFVKSKDGTLHTFSITNDIIPELAQDDGAHTPRNRTSNLRLTPQY